MTWFIAYLAIAMFVAAALLCWDTFDEEDRHMRGLAAMIMTIAGLFWPVTVWGLAIALLASLMQRGIRRWRNT